jgi:hypothetical protein
MHIQAVEWTEPTLGGRYTSAAPYASQVKCGTFAPTWFWLYHLKTAYFLLLLVGGLIPCAELAHHGSKHV